MGGGGGEEEGGGRAVSSGSALFAQVLVLVCMDERGKDPLSQILTRFR